MSSSAGNPIFQEVMRRYRKHDEELRAQFPALAAARVAFFRSKSDSDLEVMETLEGRVQAMNADLEQLAVELRGASGLSEAELATLDSISDGKPNPDNREMRVRRADLTVDRVESTADIDSLLPVALERLEAIVPAAFLEGQADVPHGMEPIIEGREPLSLIKGIRPEGEASDLHRLRQMIRVGRDYLAARPTYDHFSGALLVPQLAQLGAQLPALEQVGGDWRARIRRLWEEPSDKVDSTVFELLVAAAFVRQGRSVEFINENRGERTPDLRCMEPYPMQVECKRTHACMLKVRLRGSMDSSGPPAWSPPPALCSRLHRERLGPKAGTQAMALLA
ncbi:MAG: hypothetical protein KJ944_11715 [Alphaproteobacteria bacterium]|nr:hypothetical protein [Alphaproteobacteria bacterium]MBU1560090.1 hypothetical protein [Alphaproteobacteria bacterium]MBU2303252.1 hypothetical protein [Alphaproteobacteria bacterium]MBU2366139.1 hypothetical protein [Alphaproteobacteria bacterium]